MIWFEALPRMTMCHFTGVHSPKLKCNAKDFFCHGSPHTKTMCQSGFHYRLKSIHRMPKFINGHLKTFTITFTNIHHSAKFVQYKTKKKVKVGIRRQKLFFLAHKNAKPP